MPLTAEERARGHARANALGDGAAARAQEGAETQRLMQNWARWRLGGSGRMPRSGAYDLAARGHREMVSDPLIDGEAAETDAAVIALPAELYDAVTVRWLGHIRPPMSRKAKLHSHAGDPLERVPTSTAQQQAVACGVPLRTYYRRLSHAHARIRALMQARRNDAQRRRSARPRL